MEYLHSRFSRKYGYDERVVNEIMEDAPEWVRIAYIDGILSELHYIDIDARYDNEQDRPIGIKELNKRFALLRKVQLEDSAYDSWYCMEILHTAIKGSEWYFFYDLVELVGKMLKEEEGRYIFEEDKQKKFGFEPYQNKVNALFKGENVVWRLNQYSELVKNTPEIMDKMMGAVKEKLTDALAPARIHYKKSFNYIFSHPTDLENGVKEIVSAVESIGRIMYPKAATLGDVVKELRKNKAMPELLLPVLDKFYAFASASPAVRHGANRLPELDNADAEFIFYTGVALIRYLIKVKEGKETSE